MVVSYCQICDDIGMLMCAEIENHDDQNVSYGIKINIVSSNVVSSNVYVLTK